MEYVNALQKMLAEGPTPGEQIMFVFGLIAAIVIIAVILPDRWSLWLGAHENAPWLLVPIVAICLFIFGFNMLGAFWVFLTSINFASWVWIMGVVGIVGGLLLWRWRRRQTRR